MKQKEFKKTKKKRRGMFYYLRVWSRVFKGGMKRSYLYKTDIFVDIKNNVSCWYLVLQHSFGRMNYCSGVNYVY